jgi:hypothetical protein
VTNQLEQVEQAFIPPIPTSSPLLSSSTPPELKLNLAQTNSFIGRPAVAMTQTVVLCLVREY